MLALVLKVPLPMVNGVVHSTITCEQRLKAPPPILVTELGMVTEMRGQLKKAQSPMLFTEWGMVTEVREVHQWKAYPPMLVTPSGMMKEVRALQSKKA